jgi:hypothetical protein
MLESIAAFGLIVGSRAYAYKSITAERRIQALLKLPTFYKQPTTSSAKFKGVGV